MTSRIWDPYLTEHDRRDLDRRGQRTRTHQGTRACLLLVDLYRWVFGDEPRPLEEAVKDWPLSCGPRAWDALPRIEQLLHAARKARIPVVHTTEDPESRMVSWVGPRTQGSVPDDRWTSRFDLVAPVAPIDGEVVILKEAPSAFWGTPLLFHLVQQRVDTIIVAGESTSGCVRATVTDGKSCRYDMIVVEDCVFDRYEMAHAANLFDMHLKYADVLPLADVLQYITTQFTASSGCP